MRTTATTPTEHRVDELAKVIYAAQHPDNGSKWLTTVDGTPNVVSYAAARAIVASDSGAPVPDHDYLTLREGAELAARELSGQALGAKKSTKRTRAAARIIRELLAAVPLPGRANAVVAATDTTTVYCERAFGLHYALDIVRVFADRPLADIQASLASIHEQFSTHHGESDPTCDLCLSATVRIPSHDARDTDNSEKRHETTTEMISWLRDQGHGAAAAAVADRERDAARARAGY
jgi:hypothetical protein